ncbi:PadR family transcriptional regulator [Krasilnikovia sp. MM14-A1004]|uniref:PadR family transcriptional regulator n=1 Tax=Krasilnikovia sp. MM14-A1004 TaxID=3373541 RepID=UPI00399D2A13
MDDLGRWAEPGLLILASLADGAKHGYAITADIADEVGFALGPGTLYAALSRLEKGGLIEGLPTDGRRRPYRLTAAGAAELSSQATRMQQLAALSLERLGTALA